MKEVKELFVEKIQANIFFLENYGRDSSIVSFGFCEHLFTLLQVASPNTHKSSTIHMHAPTAVGLERALEEGRVATCICNANVIAPGPPVAVFGVPSCYL